MVRILTQKHKSQHQSFKGSRFSIGRFTQTSDGRSDTFKINIPKLPSTIPRQIPSTIFKNYTSITLGLGWRSG
jgi:hypothetical protein